MPLALAPYCCNKVTVEVILQHLVLYRCFLQRLPSLPFPVCCKPEQLRSSLQRSESALSAQHINIDNPKRLFFVLTRIRTITVDKAASKSFAVKQVDLPSNFHTEEFKFLGERRVGWAHSWLTIWFKRSDPLSKDARSSFDKTRRHSSPAMRGFSGNVK